MTEKRANKRILIAGATGVGKTWLLAAIERAALQPPRDQPQLTFSLAGSQNGKAVGDPDFIPNASELYVRAAADFFLARRAPRPTNVPQRYEFTVGISKNKSENVEEFDFLDATGELTSPYRPDKLTDERAQFLANARQAYALVFCFEAFSRNSAAQTLWNLEANLSNLLHILKRVGGRISFQRILFLLTKVDALTSIHHERLIRRGIAPPLTPLQLAEKLDPLEQMRAVVGSENIAKFVIHDSKVELAVGLSSAIGFDAETGRAMVSPFTEYPDIPRWRTPEQHYMRWTPFGVREALLFLMTGRPHSTIRVIQSGDADFQAEPRVAFIQQGSYV